MITWTCRLLNAISVAERILALLPEWWKDNPRFFNPSWNITFLCERLAPLNTLFIILCKSSELMAPLRMKWQPGRGSFECLISRMTLHSLKRKSNILLFSTKSVLSLATNNQCAIFHKNSNLLFDRHVMNSHTIMMSTFKMLQ